MKSKVNKELKALIEKEVLLGEEMKRKKNVINNESKFKKIYNEIIGSI